MLHGASSIDSVFLPLKEMARQQHNPLRLPMRAFIDKVKALLASRKNLPEHAATLRDEQFNLRLKAIGWSIKENIDLTAKFKKLENAWQEKEADHPVLVANMRFALHAQVEVMQAIAGPKLDLSKVDGSALEQLGELRFAQFESALLVGVPNQQAAQVLLGWLHASMDMEVALLMGDAVLNDEMKASPARVDALNRFLVNASQTYAASARLLGLVHTREAPASMAAEPLPAAWVKGQKQLADLGLGDWLRS
ncbi:MAG: hypothetical protein JNL52_14410 [Flavobacteriales bacterium]|nr:hypothetical protein [Flavobacteriales bacterium]